MQGYCESLRAELASGGVSVHIVSPGYIKTNLSRSAITGDGAKYNKSDASTENGAVSACLRIEIFACSFVCLLGNLFSISEKNKKYSIPYYLIFRGEIRLAHVQMFFLLACLFSLFIINLHISIDTIAVRVDT